MNERKFLIGLTLSEKSDNISLMIIIINNSCC